MSQNTLLALEHGLDHSEDSGCNSYIHYPLTTLERQVCPRGLSGIYADLAPDQGTKGQALWKEGAQVRVS